MSEIVIYTAKDGHVQLDVNVSEEDEDKLILPKHGHETVTTLEHMEAIKAINALKSEALLIAESEPAQKDLMIRLIVNLLVD